MKTRIGVLIRVLALSSLVLICIYTLASIAQAEGRSGKNDASGTAIAQTHDAETMRVQGEQRYRANCGRCHAAPRKFPPRMMATVLRHMRVRATITDEDMRLVLFYMSQ